MVSFATPFRPARRRLARLAGGLAAALALGLAAQPAAALSEDEAKAHVRATVDEVLALVRGGGSGAEKADDLLAILEKRAAMPQIARFAAGSLWRDMDAGQQDRFTAAFGHYLSVVYARRFQDYSGQQVEILGARDLGRRGIEVTSSVTGGGQAPVAVTWVVSDRPGRTVLADIVIEGVSMLITQRDEVTALVGQKGGIDGLIDFFAGA